MFQGKKPLNSKIRKVIIDHTIYFMRKTNKKTPLSFSKRFFVFSPLYQCFENTQCYIASITIIVPKTKLLRYHRKINLEKKPHIPHIPQYSNSIKNALLNVLGTCFKKYIYIARIPREASVNIPLQNIC